MNQVDSPYQGTFGWLFDPSVRFEAWLCGLLPRESKNSPNNSIFWIQGKPGSGKSTLMKYALNHSKTLQHLWSAIPEPWTLISFFFHDRGSTIQKTVNGLLQEILFQLLKHYPELLKFVAAVRLRAIVEAWPNDDSCRKFQMGSDLSTLTLQAVRRALRLRSSHTEWSL